MHELASGPDPLVEHGRRLTVGQHARPEDHGGVGRANLIDCDCTGGPGSATTFRPQATRTPNKPGTEQARTEQARTKQTQHQTDLHQRSLHEPMQS